MAEASGSDLKDRENAPVLLVDVDGVISLFGFGADAAPAGRFAMIDGLPHFLAEQAGRYLRRLSSSFSVVWCTGWEERAGEHLPHLLGFVDVPPFPHISFDAEPQRRAQWKLAAIDRYVGADRPVAWVDDAHDDRTRAWAAARPGPTLLVQTDPAVGLMPGHVEELEAFAASG